MSKLEDWRRDVDRWWVQGYVQLLRRIKNAAEFRHAYGFDPLYAADKIEKMMHSLDDAQLRQRARVILEDRDEGGRYVLTDAGRAEVEKRK